MAMRKTKWKINWFNSITLGLAVVGLVLSITIPEIRCFLRLEKCAEAKKDTVIIRDTTDRRNITKKQNTQSKKTITPTSPPTEAQSIPYDGIVHKPDGKPAAGITIVCSSCEVKSVKTGKNGEFTLRRLFNKNDEIRQVRIILSNDNLPQEVHLDWREKSKEPIIFQP